MEKILALNDQFYKLYAELSENEEFLTRKQSDVMGSCLLKQYQIEFTKVALEKEINDKTEIFELQLRSKHYIPKRTLFFYNELGKLIAKEIREEAKEYYAKLREEQRTD